MNQCWTEEISRMNGSPFNQKAKEMLEIAGEQPREDCLYGVQLALWGISHGVVGNDQADEAFVETVQAMTTWGPERLRNFFLTKLPDGRDPGVSQWAEIANPSAMAKAILEEIEERIAINFPWHYDLQ